MDFIFLTDLFYSDYARCTQIEKKKTRPYTQVYTEIERVQFAIPLRSEIKHSGQVLWTDKSNNCGLDFTKAIVITDNKYIDTTLKPHIRQNEFDSLRGKEYIVKQKMIKHIREYKKAKEEMKTSRDRNTCAFSTMQYFEGYIKDIN